MAASYFKMCVHWDDLIHLLSYQKSTKESGIHTSTYNIIIKSNLIILLQLFSWYQEHVALLFSMLGID